jgi:hypothetical protein
MKEYVDCWVDMSMDGRNNTFHVPTEQNIDPVSQSVPLMDWNCRFSTNLYYVLILPHRLYSDEWCAY